MKKNKFTLLFFLTILGIFQMGCNENTVPEDLTVVKGLNYYPLEVGKFITYRLDSIVYTQASGADCNFVQDTASHFLKEEIVDIYEDNAGAVNYIVERYTRRDASQPWRVIDVWNTKKTDTQVERVEENLRFIKLVFPVREGASWDGNSFFQDTTVVIGGETIDFFNHWSSEYEYGEVDVPEEINGIQFDSVLTVIQSEPSENKINHRASVEKYARNVGLVYKEMLILDTQCCGAVSLSECDGIAWEEKAERGLILRQWVIDFN